jgi:hypothetical protein
MRVGESGRTEHEEDGWRGVLVAKPVHLVISDPTTSLRDVPA